MEGLISKKSVIFLAILACLIAVLLVLAQENNSNPYPAINYAPNFWFDSEEQYYPANPLDFYYKNDKEVFGEIAVYRYNQLSIEEKLDKLTVFYHIEDEGTEWVYEYWLLYIFNNSKGKIKNKHYGDWEAVYVLWIKIQVESIKQLVLLIKEKFLIQKYMIQKVIIFGLMLAMALMLIV